MLSIYHDAFDSKRIPNQRKYRILVPIQAGHIPNLMANLPDLYNVSHTQPFSLYICQRFRPCAQFEIRRGEPTEHVETPSQDNAFDGVEGVVKPGDREKSERGKVPDGGDGKDGGPFFCRGQVAFEKVPIQWEVEQVGA
ncbi:hypothetical protein MD484_g2369, partial [Candolleomyces efflorescens]